MPPLSIPVELKKIAPFIRRAEELDRDRSSPESRLVAYYCRQYAVTQGISAAGSSADAKACLGSILENLEQEKSAMNQFTRDEAAFVCRSFANRVFDKADQEDRAGQANKNTAKAFYAAASFLQILQQFFEESDDSEEVAEDKKRVLYAKWKATDILKAIKEGRDPTPGGYEEADMSELIDDQPGGEAEKKQDAPPTVETVTEDDDGESQVPSDIPVAPPTAPTTILKPPSVPPPEPSSQPENDEGTEVELGPPPSYPGDSATIVHSTDGPSLPSANRPTMSFDLPPPPMPPPAPTAKPEQPKSAGMGGMFGFGKKKPGAKASRAQLADATELTRFALAALEDKDGDMAAERLQQALQALGR